jgi:hypothetical protein
MSDVRWTNEIREDPVGAGVHRFTRPGRPKQCEEVTAAVLSPGLRKACTVDRCSHCRNRIKPHHATAGPANAESSYHADCWAEAQKEAAMTSAEQQREYQRRIASEGLTALLSPYVSVFPQQREAGASPNPVSV